MVLPADFLVVQDVFARLFDDLCDAFVDTCTFGSERHPLVFMFSAQKSVRGSCLAPCSVSLSA